MPVVEITSRLPFRSEDVAAWLARPGTTTRLMPPFAGAVLQEPEGADGDAGEGAELVLALDVPGLLGTSATAAAGLLRLATGSAPPTRTQWRLRRHRGSDGGFVDVMDEGPMRSWRRDVRIGDDGAGTRIEETIAYQLPAAERIPRALRVRLHRIIEGELRRQAAFRDHQAAADLAFHAQHSRLPAQQDTDPGSDRPAGPRVVAVSGASGMIGTQVCALLSGAGLEVRRLVRRPSPEGRDDEIPWDPTARELAAEAFDDVDAVVHLAGHPLAGRFTAEHKRRIEQSRVEGTRLVARRIAEAERRAPRPDGPRALISGSAIGWYGATAADRPHEHDLLTEDLPAGADFLAGVCRRWEQEAEQAAAAGVRVATVRTGIVQSPTGGALAQLLPLVAAGVGGRLGDQQVQSWISLDDVAALIVHLVLTPQAAGPVNAVAPAPVTARRYARILADVLHRPAAVPVPSFGPRLLLGSEGAREMALADQRVSAARAEELGHAFRHRSLDEALHHVLGRRTA